MSMRLAGKVALITGSASGFGRAIAQRFAQEGCQLVLGDINEQGAKETAANFTDQAVVKRMDVTKQDDWHSAVAAATDNFKRLDILINNAGWSYKNKPTLEVSEEEFSRCFEINVRSIYHSIGACVPVMRKNTDPKGGSIISISSIGSERPRPGLVWYNATKGAVTNATKGLAAEYGGDQIRVNAIAPLLSGTGLFESFVGVPFTEENVAKFTAQVPLGRLTEAVDVANAALFLASEEGKFITGQNMVLDGGKGI